jgi:nuclease-like protein
MAIHPPRPHATLHTGEKAGDDHLQRLVDGWNVVDGVAVGDHGSIDHVVIGPGGVFTVSTKDRSGDVRLTARALTVDGMWTDDLPRAVEDARRVERCLTRAVGYLVKAFPVVSLLTSGFELLEAPQDVAVVRAVALPDWLGNRPVILTPRQVAEIAGAALRPSTWWGRSPQRGLR